MGHIGAAGHYEYAPVGDIVNTASLAGLLPGGGGIVRMVNLIGLQAALPYLLEGKKGEQSKPVVEYTLEQRREMDMVLTEKGMDFMQRQVAEITLHIVTLGRLDGMERVCLFLTDMAWRFGVNG